MSDSTSTAPAGTATDAVADYVANGFNQRLGFGSRPALVVVDFVDAYLVEGSPLYAGVDSAMKSAARVLADARNAGIPVLYTVVETDANSVFARKMGPLTALLPGSPLGKIAAPLAPRPGEPVLVKKYASAFFGTSLFTDLNLLGCDSVILVGVSTSGCIRATAVDAMQFGFVPVIVREAVGDRHESPHNAALFDLDAKYADVVDEQDVRHYLAALDATSPRKDTSR